MCPWKLLSLSYISKFSLIGVSLGILVYERKSFCIESDKFKQNINESSDCNIPACSVKHDFFRSFNQLSKNSISTNTEGKESDEENKIDDESSFFSEDDCPLDRNQLGSSAWDIIHSFAAYYPDEPSIEQQKKVAEFFVTFADLYPCLVCKQDFQEYVKQYPPRTTTRSDLVLWACRLHNSVNQKLNKPQFRCDVSLLDKRWKDGGENCE